MCKGKRTSAKCMYTIVPEHNLIGVLYLQSILVSLTAYVRQIRDIYLHSASATLTCVALGVLALINTYATFYTAKLSALRRLLKNPKARILLAVVYLN